MLGREGTNVNQFRTVLSVQSLYLITGREASPHKELMAVAHPDSIFLLLFCGLQLEEPKISWSNQIIFSTSFVPIVNLLWYESFAKLRSKEQWCRNKAKEALHFDFSTSISPRCWRCNYWTVFVFLKMLLSSWLYVLKSLVAFLGSFGLLYPECSY